MPKKKETGKKAAPKKKEGQIFSDVEREIIMADIAYLKEQEIKSGAWAKWEKDQKPYLNKRSIAAPAQHIPNSPHSFDGLITSAKFRRSVGRAPEPDDLDRCNCTEAGRAGHMSCGWCIDCDQPRFICGHSRRRR